METETTKEEKKKTHSFSIQEFLSIGYIILIIIGIYLEYLRLIPFEINILEHSDFTDFLISPFKEPLMIVVPIILSILFISYNNFIEKRKKQKEKILTEEKNIKEKELKKESLVLRIDDYKAYIILIFSFFILMNLGFGIGENYNIYNRMEKRLAVNITNAKINFIGGGSKDVYILNKNNSNLFYFENGNIELIVCPIPGNVKSIQYIPKDKQKKIDD